MRAAGDGVCGLHRLARVRAAGGRRLARARRRRLHALLRPRREGGQPRRLAEPSPGSPSSAATWPTLPLRPIARPTSTSSCTSPPSPGCGPASAPASPAATATTCSPPSACSRPRSTPASAGRAGLVVVGLRRRRRATRAARTTPLRPRSPVRGDEAGVRGPRRRLPRRSASTSSRCGTSRCTARASDPTWRCGACARPSTGGPAVRAVRRRRTIVRDFTHVDDAVDATVRPMRRAEPGAGAQRRRRRVGLDDRGDRTARRLAGRPVPVRDGAAQRGDVSAPAPTPPPCARLGWRPPSGWSTGWRRSSTGCAPAAEARPASPGGRRDGPSTAPPGGRRRAGLRRPAAGDARRRGRPRRRRPRHRRRPGQAAP